jgi:hypothetical protein
MYRDLSNLAGGILSIIPHSVRVESSFSLGRHCIWLRQSKTAAEIVREKDVIRQMAGANEGILAGDDPVLNKTNIEMTQRGRTTRSRVYCTEWPRSTTYCRCGRAAKTYMLHRRHLALRMSI